MSTDNKSLVAQQADLDLSFIQRNLRDLSKTAQFSHMSELEELHAIAYTNLKKQMASGKPLAEDPTLALETYKALSGVVMQVVETKRKAADTLIKAHTLMDTPNSRYAGEDDDFLGDEDLPDDSLAEASVSDSSIFTKLASEKEASEKAQDPAMDMAM